MILYAYVTRYPLGRLSFFLLSIPITLLDRILDRGLRVEDFDDVRVIVGVILLSIVLLGLSINLRRNRLLDLNWSPFWQAIAMWSPAASFLFMLISGGPDNYHLVFWPIVALSVIALSITLITGIALLLTPGAKACAQKNPTIAVDPRDRRNFIRSA